MRLAAHELDLPTDTRPGVVGRIALAIADRLQAERDRWILWLPVAIGFGIAVYFELPAEPPLWLGLVALLAGGLLAAARAASGALFPLGIALAAFGAGLSGATWRGEAVGAPVLGRTIGPVVVEGRVVEIGMLPEGRRILLDRPRIPGIRTGDTPARVRISAYRGISDLRTGDLVSVSATLHPPPGPAVPGGFDFQRYAWFQRLGAVGYAHAAPVVVRRAPPDGFVMWIDELRRGLTERIVRALPGDAGAFAAAIMTGDQNGLSKDAMQALRDSGLAHILSISGLHLAFAASLMLGLVRYGLALVPRVAVRWPVKKIAAVAALAGSAFYLALAGAPVPAQRAFAMLAVALIGVLVDRASLSLRLVCWAAVAILVTQPESLIGASFQLSFAAVVALIAAWEATRAWRAKRMALAGDRHGGVAGRVARHVADSALSTLVASTATAGFAIYHFNRLSLAGVVANLLAVPLTGIWVMPWGLLAMLLMPFGLEGLALVPMGWGVDATLVIARWAAALPGAAGVVPAMPGASLWLLGVGGLWLCLWSTRWRYWGLPAVTLAFALIAFHRPPDIVVGDDVRLIGVRARDGGLLLSSIRSERFAADAWTRRAGLSAATAWPTNGASADGTLACASGVCRRDGAGTGIAFVLRPEVLARGCPEADGIVARAFLRQSCPAAAWTIDRADVWRYGSHAVWLDPTGRLQRIETANGVRGDRPWVPKADRRWSTPNGQ